VAETIAITHKALQGAMAKIKELNPRGTHLGRGGTILISGTDAHSILQDRDASPSGFRLD